MGGWVGGLNCFCCWLVDFWVDWVIVCCFGWFDWSIDLISLGWLIWLDWFVDLIRFSLVRFVGEFDFAHGSTSWWVG